MLLAKELLWLALVWIGISLAAGAVTLVMRVIEDHQAKVRQRPTIRKQRELEEVGRGE